jgi:hypothetical protein
MLAATDVHKLFVVCNRFIVNDADMGQKKTDFLHSVSERAGNIPFSGDALRHRNRIGACGGPHIAQAV